jgi:hypothetical protein
MRRLQNPGEKKITTAGRWQKQIPASNQCPGLPAPSIITHWSGDLSLQQLERAPQGTRYLAERAKRRLGKMERNVSVLAEWRGSEGQSRPSWPQAEIRVWTWPRKTARVSKRPGMKADPRRYSFGAYPGNAICNFPNQSGCRVCGLRQQRVVGELQSTSSIELKADQAPKSRDITSPDIPRYRLPRTSTGPGANWYPGAGNDSRHGDRTALIRRESAGRRTHQIHAAHHVVKAGCAVRDMPIPMLDDEAPNTADSKSRSLYRRSLKLALDWSVHRHLWRGQAIYIRSLFENNRDVSDPRLQRVHNTSCLGGEREEKRRSQIGG